MDGAVPNFARCRSRTATAAILETAARNGRLSARGDRSKRPNPLLRVSEESNHWWLEISLDEFDAEARALRYQKLKLPLYVARKVSKTQDGKL